MTELWGEGECSQITQADQVRALSNWLVSWGNVSKGVHSSGVCGLKVPPPQLGGLVTCVILTQELGMIEHP